MKKLFFIFLFSFFFFLFSFSQNLVPNYSFEVCSSCPSNANQTNKAIPWYDPTSGSSDYFNACGTGYANVPFCSTGFQYARTGNAYAGIFALNGFGNSGREYIQAQLISSLMQDSCYFIEFYCNLWNNYGYAIKALGVYFSNSAVNTVGPVSVMSYNPQIVSKQFLTDTLNWMRISGYYKANGGEQYVTIGNFKPFATGDTLYTGIGGYPGSYYLIDDVTVQKITACDTITSVQEPSINKGFKLYPNPNEGNMQLEYSLPDNSIGKFVLYDIAGREINRYNLVIGKNNVLKINENELNNGVYH